MFRISAIPRHALKYSWFMFSFGKNINFKPDWIVIMKREQLIVYSRAKLLFYIVTSNSHESVTASRDFLKNMYLIVMVTLAFLKPGRL